MKPISFKFTHNQRYLYAKDANGRFTIPTPFPIYSDSDIAYSEADIKVLNSNLIEASQDDDVDTDEEVLEGAIRRCLDDL